MQNPIPKWTFQHWALNLNKLGTYCWDVKVYLFLWREFHPLWSKNLTTKLYVFIILEQILPFLRLSFFYFCFSFKFYSLLKLQKKNKWEWELWWTQLFCLHMHFNEPTSINDEKKHSLSWVLFQLMTQCITVYRWTDVIAFWMDLMHSHHTWLRRCCSRTLNGIQYWYTQNDVVVLKFARETDSEVSKFPPSWMCWNW